jgi:hypothetical protein
MCSCQQHDLPGFVGLLCIFVKAKVYVADHNHSAQGGVKVYDAIFPCVGQLPFPLVRPVGSLQNSGTLGPRPRQKV